MVHSINIQKDFKDLIKEEYGNMIQEISNNLLQITVLHIQEQIMKLILNLEHLKLYKAVNKQQNKINKSNNNSKHKIEYDFR